MMKERKTLSQRWQWFKHTFWLKQARKYLLNHDDGSYVILQLKRFGIRGSILHAETFGRNVITCTVVKQMGESHYSVQTYALDEPDVYDLIHYDVIDYRPDWFVN